MKKSELKETIREIIREEESNAAKKAKQMGLVSKGFGNWADKNGNVVASTKGGILTKVQGKRSAKRDDIEQVADSGETTKNITKNLVGKFQAGNDKQAGKRIEKVTKKYMPVLDGLYDKAKKYAHDPDNAPQSFKNNVFKLKAIMDAADEVEIEHENKDEIYDKIKDGKKKATKLFNIFY